MRIEIKGPIINDADQWIYDWFEIPATSPSKVKKLLDQASRNQVQEIIVPINSGGGSVYAASEIYTALKSFSGKVRTQIVGMAASAASYIAMAGYAEMSPVAMMMIHNASTSAWGDYNEMDDTSEFLQKVNKMLTNAYRTKTNKSESEILEMMNRTTWMTAGEAKEAGFIDEIMFESELDVVASADKPELVDGMIPRKVIDQLRQQLKLNNSPIVQAKEPFEIQNTASTGKLPEVNKEELEIMNLEQLKNEYPDLVEQIQNEAKTEAINAERNRIQEIEKIFQPGMEEIVNKAKFETGASAADTAMEILKAQNAQRTTKLTNIQSDAQILDQIEIAEAPIKNSDDEVDAVLNKVLGEGGK